MNTVAAKGPRNKAQASGASDNNQNMLKNEQTINTRVYGEIIWCIDFTAEY